MRLLLNLFACLTLLFGTGSASAALNNSGYHVVGKNVAVTVPQKAYYVAGYVADYGTPPPGYVGGTTFQNREGLLPKYDSRGVRITYKEYDVNKYVQGVNRGPERIVLGSDGSRYYTSDHYASFEDF
ncbi:MAG TPA: ribonuclease domain-containing protein [Chitinophaga sp.]|uniref:ribonuclease domain-containing protein n=1 Tax=Chitinophaga sp. TaxID=1869181 RepID=UPI002CFE99A9|nr:ribonuclease domain-containing protein [Chitinophaga sp.]HVI43713.1 ribonuclease domain-containing protein [Chitinophaga sp.]